MKIWRIALVLIALATATVVSAQYTVYELGTLGGDRSGVGIGPINSAGFIAGSADTPYETHACFWDGTMHDLGTLGGDTSNGYAINDHNQVCGWSLIATGEPRAFFWDGTMHDLGTLGGSVSRAHGINNAGFVVGHSSLPNEDGRAFLWDGVRMRDLGTLGGRSSGANDINNLNQVTGAAWVSDSKPVAFLWSADTGMINLGIPDGYDESGGHAINDRGVVVGMANNNTTGGRVAFVWDGTLRSLPFLAESDFADAWGINNANLIVGYCLDQNRKAHAVRWNPDGTLTDLSVYFHQWKETYAMGINDNGWIAGHGINPQGYMRGFLMVPDLAEAKRREH